MAFHLTDLELRVARFMLDEGRNCNGASTPEELINDNMTWTSVNDIAKGLGIKLQAAGAVLGSLQSKGVAYESGESARGSRNPDWYLSDEAIRFVWR